MVQKPCCVPDPCCVEDLVRVIFGEFKQIVATVVSRDVAAKPGLLLQPRSLCTRTDLPCTFGGTVGHDVPNVSWRNAYMDQCTVDGGPSIFCHSLPMNSFAAMSWVANAPRPNNPVLISRGLAESTKAPMQGYIETHFAGLPLHVGVRALS